MAGDVSFEFDASARADTLVIQVVGELNRESFESLYPQVEERAASVTHLIFDFKQMHYMDSGGLGMLVRVFKEITTPREGKLLIVGANSMTRQMMRFTHLDRNMPNHPTLELALAALPKE